MTKRSIEEIDREIKKCRENQSEIINSDLVKVGRFWHWVPGARVNEINRITRHVHRLYAERNQAVFRDWTKSIENRNGGNRNVQAPI